MLLRWRATVFSLIPSSAAMARLVRPEATRDQHLHLARGQRSRGPSLRRPKRLGAREVRRRPEPAEELTGPRQLQLRGVAASVRPAGGGDQHLRSRRLVRRLQLAPARPAPGAGGRAPSSGSPSASRTRPPAASGQAAQVAARRAGGRARPARRRRRAHRRRPRPRARSRPRRPGRGPAREVPDRLADLADRRPRRLQLPLRQPEQGEARAGLPLPLAAEPVRLLRLRERAPQPVDSPPGGYATASPSAAPDSQLAARLGLGQRLRPGAVQQQQLGAADQAVAAVRDHLRLRAHHRSSASVHSCARRRSKTSPQAASTLQ